MPVIILPAPVYRRLIEEFTTVRDQRVHREEGTLLPDGSLQYDLSDDLAERLRQFMLPGESYVDAIERMMAVTKGRVA